jgi:hypothetical protein
MDNPEAHRDARSKPPPDQRSLAAQKEYVCYGLRPLHKQCVEMQISRLQQT